ncbi:MAG: hypothetical protein UY13_C0002G0366 [Candidatus Pacebacteria bacterium GW2011_GWB1_47_8]|nr:MAG: hypothetical protein UX28_C0001G0513 [Candidatus Pacebacteria bacterium GW2011_GWA1_46_10]KKU84454.1 MAG: hypothetical protein UY13_C0002G0366 [Candidatus Pacebacteria bacterium GW2011_GWB1_47_8]HCR81115.1 hypothetical protein [Candidatus Paceibacterota bacterium]
MKKLLFWASLLGIVVAFLALIIQGATIRRVECVVNDQTVNDDFRVCARLQAVIGTRLLFRDFYQDEMIASLLYEPETKETFTLIRLEKSLAGRVTFYLSDQPPLFRIQQGEKLGLVSASGVFRENNEQVRVPLIVDQAQLYEQPATHQFLTEFLNALGENRSLVTQITLVSVERIEVRIPGFPLVVGELQQDPKLAAARLVIIIKQLRPREIDVAIRELDLRFELPVLRTTVSTDSGQVLIDSQE